MGFFDSIGNAFDKAKDKASNVIDTGRDRLRDAAQLPGRAVHSAASTVYHELNDAKNLASKAKNSVVSTARNINLSDVGHTVLDGAGFIPVVGAAADVANGAWYAAEGNWKNAAFSFAAAVPGVGDAAAAGKLGFKATQGVQKLARSGTRAANVVNFGAVAEGTIVGGHYALQGDWKNAGLSFASSAAPAVGSVTRRHVGKHIGNRLADKPLKNLDNISSSPTRPRWRDSETDVTTALGSKFVDQQSFLNREPVPGRPKGSTRPDNYRSQGILRPHTSIEVKNYDLSRSGGQSSLVSKVVDQAHARARHLPSETVQKIVVDVRGQNADRQQLNDLKEEIVSQSDGVLRTSDIKFLR
ncbi:hypothetical protein [Scytonema sp. NUACC26]|uniref:hypothetical protein n=1 Tax=Scytonema sp. NUACC26 TaxID=3140176 RepID=UPI0034DCB219